MRAIATRAKEPSTWAGLAAVMQAAKLFFPQYAVILDGVTALAGSVAVALPEGPKNANAQ
jgi:hypothetical protein